MHARRIAASIVGVGSDSGLPAAACVSTHKGSDTYAVRMTHLGRARVVARLAWRYSNWAAILRARHSGKPVLRVALRRGPVIEAATDEALFVMLDEIFFDQVYTPDGFAIGADDTVVDIGGNVGMFALYAARRTRGPVHVFEPFPENVDYISRNASANGAGNVHVHAQAVDGVAGTSRLYLTEMRGMHLLFDHNVRGKLTNYIDVPTTTLQEIMDRLALDSIDFLKIDCEGTEGAIVARTPDSYLARVQRIAMEYHDNVSEPTSAGIRSRLESAGFTVSLHPTATPFGYLYAHRPE